ncbi:MAG TPA: hypothetical protein PK867_25890 [Pirellulales bacterium]|nr:hypothetical protein [Pirellulales bacterium]
MRRGKVRISIGEQQEKDMGINKPVRIPASTPHRLRNEGDDYAIIDDDRRPRSLPTTS